MVSFDNAIIPLTIATGQTISNTLNAKEHYGDAAYISFQMPATLDSGTYTLYGSQDGIIFAAIQVKGVAGYEDLTLPAAAKATAILDVLPFNYIRVVGPSAAADRGILVTKYWTA